MLRRIYIAISLSFTLVLTVHQSSAQSYLLNSSQLTPLTKSHIEILEASSFYKAEKLIGFESVKFIWDMDGKVQAEINTGLNNLHEGNVNTSILNFTEAIKLDSSQWVPYYYRGVCLKLTSNLEDAIRDFYTAIKLNKKIYQTYLELGKTQQLLSRINEAENAYQNAIRLDKSNPLGYYFMGEFEMQFSTLERAKSYFSKCLVLDKNYSDAKIRLALLTIAETHTSDQAISLINEVITYDSLKSEALLYRFILNYKDNPRLSLSDINKLVRTQPLNNYFVLLRATLLIELEDYQKAFSDLHKVIMANSVSESRFIGKQTRLDRNIDLQYAGYYTVRNVYGLPEASSDEVKKAFCLMFSGRNSEAITSIKQVKSFYESPLCLFLLGVAHEHLSDHSMAWKYYDLALKLDDSILDAHKKVGIYNSNVQDWEKAESEFSKVLELNKQLINVRKLRGVARFYLKDYKGSIDDFSRYLEVDSTDEETYTSRATAYEAIGNEADAAKDRTLAIDYKLRATGYHILKFSEIVSLVNILLNAGDTTKALYHLNEFTSKNPSVAAHVFKVKILLSLGDWDAIHKEVVSGLETASKTPSYKDQYSFLLYVKGLVYMNDHNDKLAIEYFSKAILKDNRNGDAYLQRGKLYFKQHRLNLAKKDIENASDLGIVEAKAMLHEN